MVRGAGLVRLEMRCRSRVMAGWCWVSAAAVMVEDSGVDILAFVFVVGVLSLWVVEWGGSITDQ